MIELARSKDGLSFHVLEHSFELEKLKLGNFSYFQKHLGMTDYMANFKSWLKRPTVILLVAISNKKIVGWCMNERWTPPSRDGRPVHVLRAIEVSPDISRNGYGKIIFNLVSSFIPGHIITKPVNSNAKEFFNSLDFFSPSSRSSVSLIDYPGYMILEESKKSVDFTADVNISREGFDQGQQKMFPGESFANISFSGHGPDPTGEDATDALNSVDSHEGHVGVSQDNVSELLVNGDFQGEQKMMSACKCGCHQAAKYFVNGSRHGTAYICLSCKQERYFLPLKNKT